MKAWENMIILIGVKDSLQDIFELRRYTFFMTNQVHFVASLGLKSSFPVSAYIRLVFISLATLFACSCEQNVISQAIKK